MVDLKDLFIVTNTRWSLIKKKNLLIMVQATSEYNYQGVKKLFVLPYDDSYANSTVKVDSYQKIVFPIENIENCNIEIDDRCFYDQRINDPIKK